MGSGIAMVFANAGIPVLLKDADRTALDRGLTNIRKNYAASVHRGRYAQQRRRATRANQTHPHVRRLHPGGYGHRAVFEGMALKKEVFGELDRVCKVGAILASNTSR